MVNAILTLATRLSLLREFHRRTTSSCGSLGLKLEAIAQKLLSGFVFAARWHVTVPWVIPSAVVETATASLGMQLRDRNAPENLHLLNRQ